MLCFCECHKILDYFLKVNHLIKYKCDVCLKILKTMHAWFFVDPTKILIVY